MFGISRKEFDALQNRVAQQETTLAGLKANLLNLSNTIAGMQQSYTALATRATTLEADNKTFKSSLDVLKAATDQAKQTLDANNIFFNGTDFADKQIEKDGIKGTEISIKR